MDWQTIVDALHEGVAVLDTRAHHGEQPRRRGEELHRAFGYHMCAVVRVRADDHVDALAVRGSPFVALAMREWSQPVEVGVIGRCLRERAPVLVNDVRTSPDYAVTPVAAAIRSAELTQRLERAAH